MHYFALIATACLVGLVVHFYATRRQRAIAWALREEEQAMNDAALYTARVLGWLKEPKKHKSKEGPPVIEPILPDLYVFARRPAVPGPPYDYGNVTLKNGILH
jgi:hypothetical protein